MRHGASGPADDTIDDASMGRHPLTGVSAPRGGRMAAAFTGLLVVAAALSLRPGLDPESLFLDDQWVGIAVRDSGILERWALHLPMPLGFAVLEGLPLAVVGDPEVSLQIVPASLYLICVALFPLLIWRLTREPWAAALGGAVLVSAPLAAGLAVRAKHYTLDALVSIVVLLVVVDLFRAATPRRMLASATLLLGLLFVSFASVFLSGAAVLVLVVTSWLGKDTARQERLAATVSATIFGVGSLAYYLLDLRHLTRTSMVAYWAEFLPRSVGRDAVRSLLETQLWPFFGGALPPELVIFLVLAPLGILGLRRWAGARTCATVVVFYLGVGVAAVLRVYPIGAGRTDLFSWPVTVLLVCLGVEEVVRRARSPSVRRIAYVTVIALFAMYHVAVGGVVYVPESVDKALVGWVQERIGPEDALVLSPLGVFSFGYYGGRAVSLRPDPAYGHGFDVDVPRPSTHQTGIGRPDSRDPVSQERAVDRLEAFLAERPARVFYLETYGLPPHRNLVIRTIFEGGYRMADRAGFRSSSEAFLFEAVPD